MTPQTVRCGHRSTLKVLIDEAIGGKCGAVLPPTQRFSLQFEDFDLKVIRVLLHILPAHFPVYGAAHGRRKQRE
jgi:hypothetical protein